MPSLGLASIVESLDISLMNTLRVNMADYEDDGEEEFEIEEPNDYYFADEHGDLQLVLFKDCCAIRKPLTLRSNIKSFIQGVRSRVKYATSSLTTKVARISSLEHSGLFKVRDRITPSSLHYWLDQEGPF